MQNFIFISPNFPTNYWQFHFRRSLAQQNCSGSSGSWEIKIKEILHEFRIFLSLRLLKAP